MALIRATVGANTGSVGEAEVTQFSGITFTQNVADGCSVATSLSARSAAAALIDELASDLWLYVRLADGTSPLLQRFRITNVEQEWGPDGDDLLAVRGACYKRLLFRRFLNNDLSYSGIGQGTIAWALVEDTQAATNGDLGITDGTLDTATTRDRQYYAGENIGELLENLSRVIDGPRIAVGGDRVFHAYAPGTETVQAQPLILGVTARSLKRTSGADLFANVVRGTGDGEATTPVVAATAGLSTDPRGRWEATAAWPTVTEQATLAEHTEGEVQDRTHPAATWTATIEPSRWVSDFQLRAGHLVKIVVPRSAVAEIGVPTTEVDAQCTDLQVSVSARGEASVAATFVEV